MASAPLGHGTANRAAPVAVEIERLRHIHVPPLSGEEKSVAADSADRWREVVYQHDVGVDERQELMPRQRLRTREHAADERRPELVHLDSRLVTNRQLRAGGIDPFTGAEHDHLGIGMNTSPAHERIHLSDPRSARERLGRREERHHPSQAGIAFGTHRSRRAARYLPASGP
jgi:hypothetical protein